jgi:hypothetical protein
MFKHFTMYMQMQIWFLFYFMTLHQLLLLCGISKMR